MLGLLSLAFAPFLANAIYLDNEQKPLKQSRPDRVVPLIIDDHRHYHLQPDSYYPKLVSLEVLQDIRSDGLTGFPSTVAINVPFDQSIPGSVTFSYTTLNPKDWPGTTPSLTWAMSDWRADSIPLLDVGFRKGGMVSMDAHSARLSLGTPYISIPAEIYSVLEVATRPSSNSDVEDDIFVDCESKDELPNLVLGLDMGDKQANTEAGEIIVTPEQYVMEVDKGKCVLLVRSNDESCDEKVVLGWAAIRGQKVVLDWTQGRMEFRS